MDDDELKDDELFDPWPPAPMTRAERSALPDWATPPAEWGSLPPAARRLIGGLAVGLLAAHDNSSSSVVVERLRQSVLGRGGAIAAAVDRALCSPDGRLLFHQVVGRLAVLGTVEEALLERRRSVDLQLSRVRRIRSAAAGSP